MTSIVPVSAISVDAASESGKARRFKSRISGEDGSMSEDSRRRRLFG